MSAGEEEENCSICLDPVIDPATHRAVGLLGCGHLFHLVCIREAFNASRVMQCPNCRWVENGGWYIDICGAWPGNGCPGAERGGQEAMGVPEGENPQRFPHRNFHGGQANHPRPANRRYGGGFRNGGWYYQNYGQFGSPQWYVYYSGWLPVQGVLPFVYYPVNPVPFYFRNYDGNYYFVGADGSYHLVEPRNYFPRGN